MPGGRSKAADGAVLMLADGGATWIKALGVQIDLSHVGMGIRCKRFAMVVDDCVVESLRVDERVIDLTAAPATCGLSLSLGSALEQQEPVIACGRYQAMLTTSADGAGIRLVARARVEPGSRKGGWHLIQLEGDPLTIALVPSVFGTHKQIEDSVSTPIG